MENKDFDKIIRSKLDRPDSEPDAQAWDLFAQKLDIADAAGPDELDDFFREKLEQITVPPEPNAWSVFQEKMVLDEIFSDEPVDEFDVLVKDKLDVIAPPLVPGSWEAFEEKLDLEETFSSETIDDLYIDSLAYEKLNTVEVPFNPQHWDLMAEKLDEEDSVFAFLFKYKIAEAALILLALITFNQFYPLYLEDKLAVVVEQTKSRIQDSKIFTPETELAETTAASDVLTTPENPASSSDAADMTVVVPENTVLDISSREKQEMPEKSIATTTGMGNTIGNDNGNDNGKDNGKDNIIAPEAMTQEAIAQVVAPEEKEEQRPEIQEIYITVEESTPKNTQNEPKIIIPFAPGVSIAAAQLEGLVEPDAKEEALPECKSCKRKTGEKPYLRVGMLSAFDVNHVMVPYDKLFKASAVNAQGFGYGNGVSLGMRLGKWELETGAIYTNRNYTPPRHGKVEGSLEDGYFTDILEKVSFSTLNIPLNLKYAFHNTEKWSTYFMGGSNLNLLVSTNYDREQEFYNGEKSYSARMEKINSSTLSQKRFDPGLFEGGSFLENHYYTVNLGFGFERHLSPRWSIFGQSVYHHQLFSDGIGPNNDKINTLSIFAGAKVSLR